MASDYYYDDDDDDGDGGGVRRWLKLAVIGLVAVAVVGGAFWVLSRDEEPSSVLTAGRATSEVSSDLATTTMPGPSSTPQPAGTVSALTTTTAPGSGPAEPTGPIASAPASSAPVDATTTPSLPQPTEPTAPTQSAAGPGYPTNADGTPLPVIVTFAPDVITISGFVPSQAAKDRLGMLAIANSKTEARLENNAVINENVPIGVGVRVIELDAARFPEGSAEILPAHATELERVATIMNALPNLTVVVIGHADQRGDEASNYELSAKRAVAVVNFLTFFGVSPTRMSARAAGESDLLTLADDETALALNRRTEFVFYGLLVE